MRVSRAALSLVDATCLQCGGPLSADCLFDRTCSHDEQDALDAIAKLEYRDMDSKRRSDQARNRRSQMRCANEACKSFVAHASNCDPTAPAQPCAKCGSTEPARYYPRHTVLRAAAAAAEMPF